MSTVRSMEQALGPPSLIREVPLGGEDTFTIVRWRHGDAKATMQCFGSGQSLPQSLTSVAPARRIQKKNHNIPATFHTAWANRVVSHRRETASLSPSRSQTSTMRRDIVPKIAAGVSH